MIRGVILGVGAGFLGFVAVSCGSDSPFSASGEGAPEGEPSSWILRDPTVDPSSQQLDLLVSEGGCASGQRADDRIVYEVSSTTSAVVITALVQPGEGIQECPDNPLTPLTVTLSEPIRTRQVIDGATGGAPELADYQVPASLAVQLPDTGLEPIVPASETVSAFGYWEEPRCELADDPDEESYLAGWNPAEFFADPDGILAEGAQAIGLSREGWHLVRATDEFGREWRNWIQYLDGVPMATVSAQPDLLGWRGNGVACDLGGPWRPDPDPPQDRPIVPVSTSEPADVADLLSQTDGLRSTGDSWAFLDPEHRCLAWVQLEKELEQSGHVLDALYRVKLIDGEGLWQVGLSITNSDGTQALISTSGLDHISVQPSRSSPSGEPRGNPVSELRPCWLDAPLEVTSS